MVTSKSVRFTKTEDIKTLLELEEKGVDFSSLVRDLLAMYRKNGFEMPSQNSLDIPYDDLSPQAQSFIDANSDYVEIVDEFLMEKWEEFAEVSAPKKSVL